MSLDEGEGQVGLDIPQFWAFQTIGLWVCEVHWISFEA